MTIAHLILFIFSHAITPIPRYIAKADNETRKYEAFIIEYTGILEVSVMIPAALPIKSTGNILILAVSVQSRLPNIFLLII